jgi:hypothetical protein
MEMHPLPVEVDFAMIRLVGPHQDFHQGGLPGTVFPYHGVNFAGIALQGDIVQSQDTGELLGDATNLQQRRGRRRAHSLQDHRSIFEKYTFTMRYFNKRRVFAFRDSSSTRLT